MLGGEAIAINGEAVAASTFPVPCCCGGCLLYKAVRCNEVCGIPTPSAIYVCKDLLCICSASYTNCPPCDRPIEAGMFVRYGQYCYKIQTDRIYCSEFSARLVVYLAGRLGGNQDGCEPLPQGAVVVLDPIVDCCKTCFPANGCPEIQGWFPAVPCPCPPSGAFNCVVYVSCAAYFASASGSNCPVWNVECQTGGDHCVTVRPDATPVPDPPPGAVLVTSPAPFRNCCQCCAHGQGCCYDVFTPTITTYFRDGHQEVFTGRQEDCCRVANQTTYLGSLTSDQWFVYGDGHRCLVTRQVCKISNGKIEVTTHSYGAGGSAEECPHENPNSPVVDLYDIPPCANAAGLLETMLDLTLQPGGPNGRGTKVLACARSTVNFSDAGTPPVPFASEHVIVGFADVASAEGCGNLNCQPGGGLDSVPRGTPTTGCSGCGKEGL